jgi:hypothetical protein
MGIMLYPQQERVIIKPKPKLISNLSPEPENLSDLPTQVERIQQQRDQLIEEIQPYAYLDPDDKQKGKQYADPTCPDCKRTGIRPTGSGDPMKCGCIHPEMVNVERLHKRIEELNIQLTALPESVHNAGFESLFNWCEKNRYQMEYSKSLAYSRQLPDSYHSLLLKGNFTLAIEWLSAAIAVYSYSNYSIPIEFWEVNKLLRKYKHYRLFPQTQDIPEPSTNQIKSNDTIPTSAYEWMDEMIAKPFIVLIGISRIRTDWDKDIILELINGRYYRRKPMVIAVTIGKENEEYFDIETEKHIKEMTNGSE